ncbi:unnamed protein product, partial [Phaeothamnion confervicola]
CCRGDAAVIKCYSCVRFDASGKGYFCQQCFMHCHPWHRAEHNAVDIDDAEDIEEEIIAQRYRVEAGRIASEIRALLDDVRLRQQKQTSPAEKKGAAGQSRSNGSGGSSRRSAAAAAAATAARDEAEQRAAAAMAVQSLWRMIKARRRVAKICDAVYLKMYDEETGLPYYYNGIT